MELKLTGGDLSILTLIASGVSPDTHGLKTRLSSEIAKEVADYLVANPNTKNYTPDVIALGDGFKKQVEMEKFFPASNSEIDVSYDHFKTLE